MNPLSDKDIERRVEIIMEIDRLTLEIKAFIEKVVEVTPPLSLQELEEVQGGMDTVIAQGRFWLQESNPQRYIYEMSVFHTWLQDRYGDRRVADDA